MSLESISLEYDRPLVRAPRTPSRFDKEFLLLMNASSYYHVHAAHQENPLQQNKDGAGCDTANVQSPRDGPRV